jgi:hypothetical protein
VYAQQRMALDVAISNPLAKSLASLKDLEESHVDQITLALGGVSLANFDDLQRIVGVTLDEEKANDVAMALLNLAHLRRAHLAKPDELRTAVRSAMSRRRGPQRWNAEALEKWDRLGPKLDALLALESVLILEKVMDLRYNHESVLGRARLITELQPVFGDDVQEIRTFLIAQTLRLEYTGGHGPETFSLALDEQDVDLLRRECERAIEKAKALRARLTALDFSVALPPGQE